MKRLFILLALLCLTGCMHLSYGAKQGRESQGTMLQSLRWGQENRNDFEKPLSNGMKNETHKGQFWENVSRGAAADRHRRLNP